ncbi:MAG: hypothetical protein H8D78_17660 [Chloroflexi bacterium]|nr:hypothetical protein [Chloroflexota bacterium]
MPGGVVEPDAYHKFKQEFLFPHLLEQSFRADLRAIPWANDEGAFAAWCAGRTGYPVVDAAMRQLAETGWMPNRARMIVASFLTKDLLVDWRWGKHHFMQHLVDGDPAANNGGWQWTAGTGTDAAPYFRVFNPTLQGQKHDPARAFVRSWLPELAGVPDRFIHEPWKMPVEMQRAAGCIIGMDYPAPIVDHRWARQRALDAYRALHSEGGSSGETDFDQRVNLTRVLSPIAGGFLLDRISPAAPGILGVLLVVWLIPYIWRRILFVPDLECPAPRTQR